MIGKIIPAVISVISLSTPLYLLRIYLDYFDYATLLSNDLASTGILNGIMVFISPAVLALMLIIFLPSLIFSVMIPKDNRHLWNYDAVKTGMYLSLVINVIYCSALFIITSRLTDALREYSRIISIAGLMLALTGVYTINFFSLRKTISHSGESKIKRVRRNLSASFFLLYPSGILFLMMLNCYGLLIVLDSIDYAGLNSVSMSTLRVMGVVTFICVLNTIPGAVFIKLYGIENKLRLTGIVAGITLLLMFLMSMMITSITPMIINRAVTFAGVADWKVRKYTINTPDEPDKGWRASPTGLKNRYLVEGVLAYSLSNTRLFCPPRVKTFYLKRIHFVPFSSGYDREAAEELKAASVTCRTFSAQDIQRQSADVQTSGG
jgi:hypothetical protein